MPLLMKLLGLLAVQRSLSDTRLIHQLLAGAAILLLLTVVAAFMVGALLVGVFYALDLTLVDHGLTQDAACMVTIAVAVLSTVILLLVIYSRVQQLQLNFRKLMLQQSPVASRVNGLASSFFEGLLSPTTSPSRKD